jgi:integrase
VPQIALAPTGYTEDRWLKKRPDKLTGKRERTAIAVDLGIGLGLRQGEAFGLAEEDFDFTAGVVHVRRQLRWDIKGRPYFSLPKGRKIREVPLPANLAVRARSHFRRFP